MLNLVFFLVLLLFQASLSNIHQEQDPMCYWLHIWPPRACLMPEQVVSKLSMEPSGGLFAMNGKMTKKKVTCEVTKKVTCEIASGLFRAYAEQWLDGGRTGHHKHRQAWLILAVLRWCSGLAMPTSSCEVCSLCELRWRLWLVHRLRWSLRQPNMIMSGLVVCKWDCARDASNFNVP